MITPFESQNAVAITLPADWLCLELLWPRGRRPFPLTTLSFILWLIIMKPDLIYSHQAQKKIIFDLKRFDKALHTDALGVICSSLRDLGTKVAVSLRIPKQSCKIVERLPCGMPNDCTISST